MSAAPTVEPYRNSVRCGGEGGEGEGVRRGGGGWWPQKMSDMNKCVVLCLYNIIIEGVGWGGENGGRIKSVTYQNIIYTPYRYLY